MPSSYDILDELVAAPLRLKKSHPSDRRVKGVILIDEGRHIRRAFWERLTSDTGRLVRLNSREPSNMRGLLRSALQSAKSP